MQTPHTSGSQDFAVLWEQLAGQFRLLDPKDPSLWPAVPRLLLCTGMAVLTMLLAWQLLLQHDAAALQAARQQEMPLRESYRSKLARAVGLEGLKQQREQVQRYVAQLEKQLPSKAEMAVLLSDISQAGLGRKLQFELFRPGAVLLRDYYAELPIALRVSGSYHDMGAFAADIAQMPRIVTLGNISMAPVAAPGSSGRLVMDATVRTYRYLDAEEVAGQKAAEGGRKGGG